MTDAAGVADPSATVPAVARLAPPTDARRWLQLGLAAAWLMAGLLQAQSYMFTPDFAKDTLAGVAEGNPDWIAASIRWAAHLVQQQSAAWNTVFFLIQLALGLGIAFRPTLKAALAASVAWSLLVWWFGEGLGGLLTGGASPLSGAPGGVLLYAVLAVLLWPPRAATEAPNFVAARPVGAPAAKVVWLVLWLGLAVLGLQPANLAAGGLHDLVAGMGDGQPGWIAGPVEAFTAIAKHNGPWLTVVGSVMLAAIAVGGVLAVRIRRVAIGLAVLAALFIWLVGQGLGGLFGGQSTDLNSGPLLVLFALAYWPRRGTEVGA